MAKPLADNPSHDPGSRSLRAASFEHGADVYAQVRPSYPDDAVDWLVPAAARRVLDLGAGTGLLTRSLVARGLDVVAVDPSPAMLDQLRSALPSVEAHVGRAEAISLPDESVDAVVVAQAWHWTDKERAVPEVARVLRPGGTLGLVWNRRDTRLDWVARLSEILHAGDTLPRDDRTLGLDDRFGPVEQAEFAWTQLFPTADLRSLAASRSYFLTLPDDERAALLDRVDDLAAHHPDLVGRQTVGFPYVTECWRACKAA